MAEVRNRCQWTRGGSILREAQNKSQRHLRSESYKGVVVVIFVERGRATTVVIGGGGREQLQRRQRGGEKNCLLCFLNFDVWIGGCLSGWLFCSRRIPRVQFHLQQSYYCLEYYCHNNTIGCRNFCGAGASKNTLIISHTTLYSVK